MIARIRNLLKQAGFTRKEGARTGVVTFIQRFGSALNLNVHLHMLVLDGVYAFNGGKPRFHRTKAPDAMQLQALLQRIVARITRQLVRAELLVKDPEQTYLDLDAEEPIDHFAGASIRYRVILGPNAGSKTLTLGLPRTGQPTPPQPLTVTADGFSLNAAVACQAHERRKLERLCRYVARPPLALERLNTTEDGKLSYKLKRPYANGTTHFMFEPLDLLARLATLVPRPRLNLIRYHGVFAPNFPQRRAVVPRKAAKQSSQASKRHKDMHSAAASQNARSQPVPHKLTWAERLKRAFEFDVTVCPLCSGTLRVIADITDPDLIKTILNHIANTRAPPVPKRVGPGRTEHQTNFNI